MNFRIRMAALLGFISIFGMTAATTQTQGPCSASEFRQFDFWVGTWSVADETGKPAGENEITLEQDGCVLIERWHSASGNTGMSVNYYDPRLRQWRQHWVGLGLVLEMSGNFRDGAMVLEGPLHYVKENRTTLLRGVWTSLPDGRVRQLFTESADNGKTWTPWFDGYYTKIPARVAPRVF